MIGLITQRDCDILTGAARGPVYGTPMRLFTARDRAIGSLTRRGLLAPGERGGYVLTDEGRDLLRLIRDGTLRVCR